MLSGTRMSPPGWCQPAPSQIRTAWARGATCVLISLRCSFIASVFALGMMMAAPTPRSGQIAPPGDCLAKVKAKPPHHLVGNRIGPLQDQSFQLRHLLLIEGRCGAGAVPRLQAIHAGIIVAMHPITERLPIHSVLLRRLGA